MKLNTEPLPSIGVEKRLDIYLDEVPEKYQGVQSYSLRFVPSTGRPLTVLDNAHFAPNRNLLQRVAMDGNTCVIFTLLDTPDTVVLELDIRF